MFLRGGAPAGIPLAADLLLLGSGIGLGLSPTLAAVLTRVPVAEAVDASGVLVTAAQLGLVIGVAAVGPLYLSAGHGGGAAVSAHALVWRRSA